MIKYKIKDNNKPIFVLFILIILICLSIAVFSTIGSANIRVIDTIRIILSKIPLINKSIDTSDIPKSSEVIILNIRIPRVLISMLVGSSLAGVGAVLQGLFKNPMADPYIIGISSGAAFGAGIFIVLGVTGYSSNISLISIGAFIGALSTIFLVYWISRVKNKIPITTLLLSGVAIGQLLTSMLSFMMIISTKDMDKIIYWTLGSFAGKGWDRLIPFLPIALISFLILLFYYRDLNIMLMGEESAQGLGIDVERTKLILLIVSSLITAISVSISGTIGFVGLIVPHIIRLIIGANYKYLLPCSILAGGIFLSFADTVARTIISPTEIPVGIVTAILGGPFFIYLLRKNKRMYK
ncbi:iron compound ABC transporter, permease component FhuG [Gottschalkia purinilytica]|uniref:Iron compound ABC transporter, permease component FhuG n=1 Tax=Gottschalkia purinilytica TaxID=1503 RepID=A0A0L0WF93_GOTPU|nr:iron chelate uptake ABC transporter family permease subunit [Gottschalkia purinilytica]KNF10139.1 iron compound ABC transporter, permease component FhuG [Gottschalkia purinilytica]